MVSPGSAIGIDCTQGAVAATRRFEAPQVAWVLLIFAALWSALLAATSLSPPVDSIEQWIWSHALAWGYYKHPPLATWLLWCVNRVFGASLATVTLLGAATTMGAFACFWCLLRRLRGPMAASVALLAALCISFYNGRLNYYNHETVLLLTSTACACALERALATRRRAWWLGVGVCLGLGALAKYQAVLTLACVVTLLWHERAWREPSHRRGMLQAAVMALLLMAPHAVWLATQHDGPIQYAVGSSMGAHLGPWPRTTLSLHFLVDAVFNRALPALLVLAAVALDLYRTPREAGPVAARDPDRGRALLLIWGLLPLALVALLGLTAGVKLQLHWGMSFLLFLVPALMELTRVDWSKANLRLLVAAFLLVQAILVVQCTLQSPLGPAALRDTHWRQVDSTRLAAAVAPAARRALGGPVRVVSGPTGMAGALALRLPEQPLVLIDGNYLRSPWVRPDLVTRCGVLEIGPSAQMVGGRPIGDAAPGWSWRAVPGAVLNGAAGAAAPAGCDS